MPFEDEFPLDPDWDHVPPELRSLAGQPVALVTDDGVELGVLAVAPGLFGHADRVSRKFYDEDGGST